MLAILGNCSAVRYAPSPPIQDDDRRSVCTRDPMPHPSKGRLTDNEERRSYPLGALPILRRLYHNPTSPSPRLAKPLATKDTHRRSEANSTARNQTQNTNRPVTPLLMYAPCCQNTHDRSPVSREASAASKELATSPPYPSQTTGCPFCYPSSPETTTPKVPSRRPRRAADNTGQRKSGLHYIRAGHPAAP